LVAVVDVEGGVGFEVEGVAASAAVEVTSVEVEAFVGAEISEVVASAEVAAPLPSAVRPEDSIRGARVDFAQGADSTVDSIVRAGLIGPAEDSIDRVDSIDPV
jgi:hypothetical protein